VNHERHDTAGRDALPAPEDIGLRQAREALKRALARCGRLQVEVGALQAEIAPLRRAAGLWRAGVRNDAGAKLLLQQLPEDTDWDDPEAVPKACSAIVAQVLGARDQLAEATP
jgi:hypothetical protein